MRPMNLQPPLDRRQFLATAAATATFGALLSSGRTKLWAGALHLAATDRVPSTCFTPRPLRASRCKSRFCSVAGNPPASTRSAFFHPPCCKSKETRRSVSKWILGIKLLSERSCKENRRILLANSVETPKAADSPSLGSLP